MKPLPHRLHRTIRATLLVACGVFATSAWAKGTIVRAEGGVWLTAPGSEETHADVGAHVASGARLRTDPTGSTRVRFEDGSLLELRPSTSLIVSKSQRRHASKTAVVMFFGRVWSKVTKALGGEPNYEITTANAVCGVRGTEFETIVGDDGGLRVEVREGTVDVSAADERGISHTSAGQTTTADETGVAQPAATDGASTQDAWLAQRRQRVQNHGKVILGRVREGIMARKARIEALRSQQRALVQQRDAADARARRGDRGAIEEVREYNRKIAALGDQIADEGDGADAQFGLVDHFADLARDPRFGMLDRKTIEADAANLRRVKASLDALVKDGTDLSMKGMERMLDDMNQGRGGLRDPKGSAADDLFGPGDMELR